MTSNNIDWAGDTFYLRTMPPPTPDAFLAFKHAARSTGGTMPRFQDSRIREIIEVRFAGLQSKSPAK